MTQSNQYFEQGDGSLFVQPDGPNTPVYYLGCHDIGDIPMPMGDVTEVLCPDPVQIGKYQRVMTMQGVPGRITTNVATYLGRVADYLDQVRCPAALYIAKNECGRRDLFTTRDWLMRVENFRITQKTISNLAHRTDRNPSGKAFDLSADSAFEVYNLLASMRTIAEAEPMSNVTLMNDEQCGGSCGISMGRGKYMLATDDSAVGPALSSPWLSSDYGISWTASATSPFAAGYHSRAACYVQLNRTTRRMIVGNGSTIVAGPAQIAYCDDALGTTWTVVNVGAHNGEFLSTGHALWALDWQHIWAATEHGNIFFSNDGGLTWTAQYAAGAVSLTCVRFIDKDLGLACGSANTLARTVDGGIHWVAVSGPAAMAAVVAKACWLFDDNSFWVLYAGGQLYSTIDSGATWSLRAGFPVTLAVGADIKFLNRYDGFIGGRASVGGVNYGVIMRTIDGGMTWDAFRSSAALAGATDGVQCVAPLDVNHVYGVGTLIGAAPLAMDVAA